MAGSVKTRTEPKPKERTMAKEEAKTEEKVEEKATEQVEDNSPEAIKSMTDFDAKIDSDDDTAVEDNKEEAKGEEDDSAKGKQETPAEEKTDDDDSGKEKKAEEKQSADDKEIEEAAKALEESAKAEDAKPEAQKQAEALAAKQAEEATVAKEAEAKQAEKYVSDLDPTEWDEDAIKADTDKGQKHLDQMNELKSQNANLQAEIQQQANDRYGDWMNRKVEALGEDFHEVFGDGDWEDLLPGSPEIENRINVGNKMNFYAQAYNNAGKQVPPRNALFKRAVSELHNTIVNKSKNEEETGKKLKARAGQTLARSKSKASAQTTGEKAIQGMKDFDAKIDSD